MRIYGDCVDAADRSFLSGKGCLLQHQQAQIAEQKHRYCNANRCILQQQWLLKKGSIVSLVDILSILEAADVSSFKPSCN